MFKRIFRNKSKKEILVDVGIGLTKSVLIALFVGAVLVAPGGVAGTLKVANDVFGEKPLGSRDRKKLRRTLYYLKSKKLIHIQSQYQKDVFTLTKPGWFAARRLYNSFVIEKPREWDGRWRIVIFDIPETKKGKRELFRYKLRALGLANVQKSIWAHPFECREQVFYLAREIFILPYVRYIVADEITGEQDLRRRFEL
ncbi:MAG: hypothetical protein HY398_02360 [Candidatus Doudnabacteria bacterium]|nr:hypothetical protein [Candidatus Doudnabacteria bacterium]